MSYVFGISTLHEIARMGAESPRNEMFEVVTEALVEHYPGRIHPTGRWIFNNAGGAMGSLMLLHASLSEYLIFFGTPIGTHGHSGRYMADVYDFMMSGEMWCYTEDEIERAVFGPGDMAYLPSSRAKGYRIPESAWMLEYARGFIPSMLPFGLLDVFTSTLDHRSFRRTVVDYGRLVTSSWSAMRSSHARRTPSHTP